MRSPRPTIDAPYVGRTPRWRSPQRIGVAVAALVTLAVHGVSNALTPYGLHRDELLYLAMGRHLHFWRMDFPPAIALLAALSRALTGDSLVSIRLTSALAAAGLVALAYATAQLLGGNARARALAGLAVLASPLFLRTGTLFQPVVFDELWWTVGLVALGRVGMSPSTARRPPSRYGAGRPPAAAAWLVLGAAVGLGLLTKFSIAFFAASVAVGILATPLRQELATRWPWVAAAIALVTGSPSIVGQVRLGWPVVGQLRELHAVQLGRLGPLDFVAGQLVLGPAVALAGLGLWHLLRAREMRPWRAVGWTCVTAFLLLLVLQGKPYYVAPVYPTLFAAGAVALEHRLQSWPRHRRLASVGAFGAIALYGLLTLPLGLPLLPPTAMARYAAAFGPLATATNTGGRLALPQDYADMLGWPAQAARVGAVIDSLPEAQRRDLVLVAGNYGEAGALEFYGARVGLPPVVSPAGSFWFFGPGNLPGTISLSVGIPVTRLQRYCRRVTPLGTITHDDTRWVVDEERAVALALCEEPYQTLQDLWPSLRPR